MATHVYRFQFTGVPLAATIQRQIGGAVPVVGSIGPNTYVDITVDSTQLADLQEYMASIGYGTLAATDPTTTPAQQAALISPETSDYYLITEGRVTGNATRVGQTSFDGCSFFLRKPVSASKLLFRATGYTAGGSVKILLFQQASGLSGVAARVATVSAFDPGGTGNFTPSFAEGTVNFQPGLVYCLFGRDSVGGSVTFRTYTTQANDLNTANVQAGTHPTSFSTATLTSTTPATFDPTSPTATSSDVIPIMRLLA